MGKTITYPKLIIPFRSQFRKIWNLLISILIVYEVFWYSFGVTYMFHRNVSLGMVVFEAASALIFLADILINFRTTYINKNNEEIVNQKMIAKHYAKSTMFFIDVITILPISEILLLAFPAYRYKFTFYSFLKLIKLLRIYKLKPYLNNWTYGLLFKILRILVTFFLIVRECSF